MPEIETFEGKIKEAEGPVVTITKTFIGWITIMGFGSILQAVTGTEIVPGDILTGMLKFGLKLVVGYLTTNVLIVAGKALYNYIKTMRKK